MKQVHVARHAPEAHLVKGFLESNGIAAVVRGEYLTSGWGELPADVCSVWVAEDADYERAAALLVAFFTGEAARRHRAEAWSCPHCGERLEGQFTECWKCGAARLQ